MSGGAVATGRAAEAFAAEFLQRKGLRLLERNYRCRCGEIDLLMRDGDTLVFVEVRFRRNDRFGSGAESVDARKQAKLVATAQHYLQRHGEQPCRFDVVSLSDAGTDGYRAQWISDAFRL